MNVTHFYLKDETEPVIITDNDFGMNSAWDYFVKVKTILHNIKGPSIIQYNYDNNGKLISEKRYFYVNGIEVMEDEFEKYKIIENIKLI